MVHNMHKILSQISPQAYKIQMSLSWCIPDTDKETKAI